MKTIAFYSYKGGVGRTLAVGHVAYWLSKLGKTVFMLDMDLEAPGLHYKLNQFCEQPAPVKGLVDYLGYFRREHVAAASLNEYTIKLKAKELEMSDMWLMPAGDPFTNSYWKQLSEIDWKEFLYNGDKLGALLFLELKLQIEKEYKPDFLLIDSRTGLTDLTGIGLDLLADDALVFGVYNAENIEGARIVMERLRRREKLPIKEEKTRLHFVLTRIPAPERKEDIDRENDITTKVLERLNAGSGIATGPLVTKVNVVHIDPGQAIEERIRFVEKNPDQYPIVKDYVDLVLQVTGLGKDEQTGFWEIWEQFHFANEDESKLELAQQLVAMESNIPDQEFQRGYFAQEFLKDLAVAIKAYSNVIHLQPDNSYSYNNRGNVYADLVRYDEAIADYNKAIELKPDNAGAYNNRGNVKRKLMQFTSALDDINRSLELNPQDAHIYGTLAEIHSDAGNADLFYEAFQKTLDLDPTLIDELDETTIARHQNEARFQAIMAKYCPPTTPPSS